MWTQTDVRSAKITRKLALEFANMPTIPNDRKFSPRRAELYRVRAEQKTFRSPEWAKCFCKQTGETIRINGKHTSVVFSEYTPENLQAIITSYEADTMEDVVRLYNTFDSREQSRNSGDINRSFSGSVEELREFPDKMINDTISGMSIVNYGFDYTHVKNPTERAEQILDPDNIKFTSWLGNNIWENDKRTKHIQRSAVVGAMYSTYNRCQKDALEFWQRVRDETGTTPKMPCRQLANWLKESQTVRGHSREIIREYYYRCIYMWNAFRNGLTDIGTVKYSPAYKIPRVV